MSIREKILTILAVIFCVGLTAAGVYAIGAAVWVHFRFPTESMTPFASILFGALGVLALAGAALLLRRAFGGPKRSGK